MSLLSPVGNFFNANVNPFPGVSFYYRNRPAVPFGMSLLGTYSSKWSQQAISKLMLAIRSTKKAPPILYNYEMYSYLNEKTFTEVRGAARAKPLTLSVFLFNDQFIAQNNGASYMEFPANLTGLEMGNSARLKGLDIVGRNLQNYHYGGGEGTLRFTVQWRLGAKETIFQLSSKLAALSMSSGYGKGFPVLSLKLGPEESNPFAGEYYILEKSTFIPGPIVQGVNRSITPTSKTSPAKATGSDGITQPIYGEQQLEFKRISPDQIDNHIWTS